MHQHNKIEILFISTANPYSLLKSSLLQLLLPLLLLLQLYIIICSTNLATWLIAYFSITLLKLFSSIHFTNFIILLNIRYEYILLLFKFISNIFISSYIIIVIDNAMIFIYLCESIDGKYLFIRFIVLWRSNLFGSLINSLITPIIIDNRKIN